MQRQIQRWVLTGAATALSAFLAVPAAISQSAAPPSAASPTADQPAQKTIQLVPALASLDKGVDAKKAKQGDAVTAKLQKDIMAGDTQIPKNSVLVGHIDQVQASQSKSDSTVVVTFDQAKLKNGQQVPIKATVLAIAPPPNTAPTADDGGGGAAMPPSAGVSGGGGSSAGSRGSGSSGGSQAASTPAPSTPTQGMTDASSSGPQQQQQAAGVPGVTLKSDIHQQDSATFTSTGKNVRLPDGMQMQFALAVVPAGVKLQ